MRRWVKGLVCLSFGALAASTRAAEPRPVIAESQPAAAVELTRTPAITLDRPQPQCAAAPVASLGRPVALTPTAASVFDPRVARASYEGSVLAPPREVIRGQSEELHQPMPVGPKGKEVAAEAGPILEKAPAPHVAVTSPVVIHTDGMAGEFVSDDHLMDGHLIWDPEGAASEWLWFRGEYLMWWINQSRAPALVTTSPAGTPREQAGILGLPTTTVLVDGAHLSSNDPFSGGRFTIGGWLTDNQTIGLEATYFFLGQRTTRFSETSSGAPLVRPFFEVSPLAAPTNTEAGELVAFPGLLSGTVSGSFDTQFWGAELNTRIPLWCGCCYRVDFLAGGRYLDLRENLRINETLLVTEPGPTNGTMIFVADHFGTINQFYGGQIGLEGELRWRRWSIDGLAKIALGNVHEVVNIDGLTEFVLPGGAASSQLGGLLTAPSNIGHFTHNRFTAVPEAGFKVGYQITEHMRAHVGYTFLYLSNAVRPGEQVDRVVNSSQLPTVMGPGTLVGLPRPTVLFRETDFWAQGLDFGLEFRY